MPDAPRIDVVGLGPAGPDLMTAGTLALLASADRVFLRTGRHPAAVAVERGPDLRPPLRVGRHVRRCLPARSWPN